ncbi:MAG: cold shock domain-containing protein [Candidatus Promineifilaceae bacterium]|nr:cold shock domain-containing protein [Candidatus Promineifilaceae bacterium]
MNFRDRFETDADGNQFLFTVEMQRRLSKAGLPVEVEYLSQLEQISAPQAQKEQKRPTQQADRDKQRNKQSVDEPESIQIDPMTGKYIGRIKWYNARKGYGFLLRGGGEEIFFHRSAAVGDPEVFSEGLWILYDVEETNKGPEATDIEPYDQE